MKLQRLIDSLKSPAVYETLRIDNIDKIILKLEEMNSMIEMEDVKNSFVSQLLLILTMRRRGFSPPFKKMHMVLSGPPGVGKTSMSIWIAEVWDALNIMDKSLPKKAITNSILESVKDFKLCKVRKDFSKIVTEIQDKITEIMLMIDKEHGDTEESENIPDYIKSIYGKSQTSIDLCQEIIEHYSKYLPDYEETTAVNLALDKSYDTLDDELELIEQTSDTKPYVVLGRADFVGSYQGKTSEKTEAVLKQHKGKVIIIEEAYSLFNDEKDSYGMEALTIINRYMDEHSDDYIFILNGYTDMLEQTIFKAQPGLKRRIQWTFNIQGYTGEGIFRIFVHQLNRLSKPYWIICPCDFEKIRKFFHDNKKCFPYYGGNTEKLILYIQMEYGEKFYYQSDGNPEVCEISLCLLKNAFSRYITLNPEILRAIKDDEITSSYFS